MAASRLEKIGTIFSRVTGLLRAGAMDVNEKPIWYDIYRAFPPKIEPLFARKVVDTPIKEILYPEDSIRAFSNFECGQRSLMKRKLHKTLGKKLPGFNLMDNQHATVSQKIILKTLEYQKANPSLSEDNALSQAIESYNNEIRQFKNDDIPQDIDAPKFGYKKNHSLVGEYKRALETKVDLQKIMSEEDK